MAERWHVWARVNYNEGAYITAGCDTNAEGLTLAEAVEYGMDALRAVGGDVDEPGEQLTITVKLVDV